MNSPDEFHPSLHDTSGSAVDRSPRTRVHHVKASELSSATAQTAGMQRFAAITGGSVGSEKIWMGETKVAPQTVSDNHHHGESETAIFVRSEENPDTDTSAVIVIARSTQEAIVVNLPALYALSDQPK